MRQMPHRLFLIGLVVPLVLVLAALGIAIAREQQRSRAELVERFGMRAQLAARFVEAYVDELADRQRSVAAARLSGSNVTRSDFEQVVSARGYPAAVLLDPEGRLLQVAPRAPQLLGRRMTARYAHLRTAVSTGRVAVSNVVASAAAGIPVTAIAVPYRTPYGRRVFSGAYDLAHTPLSAYLANFHPVSTSRARIVDAAGRVVASDGHASEPARGGRGVVVSEVAVAGTPWTIRASVSRRALLAPVEGSRAWLPWLVLAALGALGVVAIVLASRRRRANELLHAAHARADQAFEHAAIGVALLGLDGRWMRVNPQLCALFGYTEAELLAMGALETTHPDDLQASQERLSRLADGTIGAYSVEKRFVSATGETIWALTSVSLVRDVHGQASHFVCQIQDVTERRRLREELTYQATHDSLTGLWNRRRFEEELAQIVGRARRYGECGALLVLDVDRFKAINDTLGHHVGDQLIAAVAQAISSRVRATDGVARLGGDEFAVLLLHVTREDAGAIARDVAGAVRGVTVNGDAAIRVTASVGVAFIDGDCADPQDVLIRADRAMYDAKAAGRDRVAPA